MADPKQDEQGAGGEGQDERIPPEQWIPHPPTDYVDWMERDPPLYESDVRARQAAKEASGPASDEKGEKPEAEATE